MPFFVQIFGWRFGSNLILAQSQRQLVGHLILQLNILAARYIENGQPSLVAPVLENTRHRLAAIAGTSTCFIFQVGLRFFYQFSYVYV